MLYFIGLIPPPPLNDEIQGMKMEFKKNYQSAHALNAPPHITLISPFRIREEVVAHKLLQDFAYEDHSFEVKLENFSHFEERVIFIDVRKDQALEETQKALKNMINANLDIFEGTFRNRPFRPHLTLAFKDLSKMHFQRAWEIYRSRKFKEHFMAKELVLLKHDKRKWQIQAKYKLGEQ